MSGRPLLPAEKGFSLIETVIAISCSTLLLLALLSTTGSILLRLGDLNRALERDENLELAPLILAPLLSQAGNNMAFSSQPAVELQGEELVVRSDSSGAGGFPDGALDGPFEWLGLKQKGDQLYIRSGQGSYQPMLKHITEAGWLLQDDLLLQVHLAARFSTPVPVAPSRRQLELDLFLFNRRSGLFPQ